MSIENPNPFDAMRRAHEGDPEAIAEAEKQNRLNAEIIASQRQGQRSKEQPRSKRLTAERDDWQKRHEDRQDDYLPGALGPDKVEN